MKISHKKRFTIGSAAVYCLINFGMAHAQTSPSTSKEDENKTDDIIIVTGRAIENYSAVDSLTGTKSNALLKDLPLSVSVVPEALIADRSISYLGEALDSVAGAQRKQGYGGTQNFGAFIRGFDSSFLTLRNGIRDFGFYTLRDTANVERFEILKGPGSVLYGALRPGGITNTITKKPTEDNIGDMTFIAGSNDRYRGEADFGGAISDNVFYRFNAAVDDSGSFRDHVNSDGYFISPAITIKFNDDFAWTIEGEHRKSNFTWDLGFVKHPASLDLPINRFLGEPDSRNDVKSTTINSTVDYNFNENWSFKQATSYAETQGDYELRSAWRYSDDGLTGIRSAFDSIESSSSFAVVNDIIGEFATGSIEHNLVIGFDYYRAKQSYTFDFLSLPSISLNNPVYGQPLGSPFPLFAEDNETNSYGIYLQDLISLSEQWKLLIGGRYDWVKYEALDTLANTQTRDTDDNAFSPQVGIVYQPTETTSLYASYSQSFLPILSGRTFDNTPLKPESGKQFEVGVKQGLMNNKISATLALFHITKENVNTADPINPTFIIQTGEQKSRGVEFELSGEVLEGWDVTMGTAYIDAFVSKDNRVPVDSTLVGIPKYSANLWTKYSFQSDALSGLSIGAGAFYADKRQATLPNQNWFVPSYVRFDSMAAYQIGDVTIQLNLKNITNKKIYDLTGTTFLPQEPRSVSLRLSYSFF